MIKKLTEKKYWIKYRKRNSSSEEINDFEKAAKDIGSKQTFYMSARNCPLYKMVNGKQLFTESEKKSLATTLGTTVELLDPKVEKSYWGNKPLIVNIASDTIIDLNSIAGLKDYLIAMSVPGLIAPTKEDVTNTPSARFYLVDEDDDVKEVSSRVRDSYETMKIIEKYDNNEPMLRSMLSLYCYMYQSKRVVGSNMPITKIKDELIILSNEDSTRLRQLIENEDFDKRMFLLKALDCGAVVERNLNYYASFNDSIPIAASFHQAVDYLSDPRNNESIKAIKNDINEKTK